MNKRITALVAGGVLAGASLLGVPAYALANQSDATPSGAAASSNDIRQMGAAMSDPQFQNQMKSFMSEMMSDPQLRQQMVSMMSEAMAEMDGQMDGQMDMGDMGSGTPQGKGKATP